MTRLERAVLDVEWLWDGRPETRALFAWLALLRHLAAAEQHEREGTPFNPATMNDPDELLAEMKELTS